MKTLKTIQTLSKIGKIISKIMFICCIVGFCVCIVGIIDLSLGTPVLKLGGVTLESVLQNKADVTPGTMYASVAAAAILCVGEGVLAKFAVRYFDRELTDGTPFTFDGAKELLRLGILSICIPVGVRIIAQIVQTVLAKVLTDVEPLNADPAGSVAFGIMLIVAALLCKYGAELSESKAEPSEELPQ